MDPQSPKNPGRATRRPVLYIAAAGGSVAAAAALYQASPLIAAVGVSLFWALLWAILRQRVRKGIDQPSGGRGAKTEANEAALSALGLIDAETGLAAASQLEELLRREIARCKRYGDRTTLVLIEVRVTGFKPSREMQRPPSPAPFVAEMLKATMRDADIVARVGVTRFATVLAECDMNNAQNFADRVRTRLSSNPFAHMPDGSAVYTRSWAGWTQWHAGIDTAEAFIEAAMADMQARAIGYEGQHLRAS